MTYSVMPLRMADHCRDLARLWMNFENPHNAGMTEKRMSWFYDQNPLGPARTWLVVDSNDGRIIGCGSVFPWNKQVNGRTLTAGVPSDFVVDPKRRIAGPAVTLQRAVLAESVSAGFQFLVGAANQKSRAVCLRVGYHAIGNAFRWVKPLHAEYWLSRRLRNPFLTKVAGSVVTRALVFFDQSRRIKMAPVELCEALEKADERFDELWSRAKNQYSIAGERSARYLNWRYTASPEIKYRFYALFNGDNQRLSAYLVYSIEGEKVSVVDLFGEYPQTIAIDELLLRFADWMRIRGWHSIEITYFGKALFEKRLRRLGFFRREERQTIVLHAGLTVPQELRRTLSEKENWVMFGGEMDV
jgi:hypothetical protein